MIGWELPRTKRAGWGRGPCRIESRGGFSFSWLLRRHRRCCPENHRSLDQAVAETLCCCSVVTAMAHTKPISSRPKAATIWFWFFPRADIATYRWCSRCCAFQAIFLASSLITRVLLSAQEEACDIRPMLIRPSRFHQNPPEVAVARFGNTAALDSIPLECSHATRPL